MAALLINKLRVKQDLRRAMAARLKKKNKHRVKHDPRRLMAARLLNSSFMTESRFRP